MNIIDKTLNLINTCISSCEEPVVLCSFGKDSLVLLDLARKIKKDIDVIFWKEPFYSNKFSYAEQVIREWDIKVYNYPATFITYMQNEDWFDICSSYYINGVDWLKLFSGCVPPKNGEDYLCAGRDWLNMPTVSNYVFKWDCVFHGHKQSDNLTEDISLQIGMDKKELKSLLMLDKRKLIALPLKEWSDQDIWAYIKDNNLPYNKARYDDKQDSANPDKYPTCFKCLDYRNTGKGIYCEKYKKEVLNMAKSRLEQGKALSNFMSNNYFKRGDINGS